MPLGQKNKTKQKHNKKQMCTHTHRVLCASDIPDYFTDGPAVGSRLNQMKGLSQGSQSRIFLQ